MEMKNRAPTRPTAAFLIACTVCGMSMCINLFNVTTLNFPQRELMNFVNESLWNRYNIELSDHGLHVIWGAIVGGPVTLSCLGGFCSIPLAEYFGRKIAMFLIHNSICLIFNVLGALAKPLQSLEAYIISRILGGITFGMALTLLPIYNTEISHPRFRGIAGSFSGLIGNSAILITMMMSLPEALGTKDRWPYLHVCGIFISLLLIAVGLCQPESPKFAFVNRGEREKSIALIKKLHGEFSDVDSVLEGYQREAQQTKLAADLSMRSIWSEKHLRKGLIIGIAAAAARGVCGIDIFTIYGAKLLNEAFSIPETESKYAMLGLMLFQIPPVIILPFVIERIGRRPLFLGTLCGMIVCYIGFVLFYVLNEYLNQSWLMYLSMACLALNGWIFPFGVTPIGFILVAEVTPQRIRSKCTSIAICVFFLGTAIHFILFPILDRLIGAYTIVILVIIPMILSWIFLYLKMPETRGIPVDAIVDRWMISGKRNLESSESSSMLLSKTHNSISL